MNLLQVAESALLHEQNEYTTGHILKLTYSPSQIACSKKAYAAPTQLETSQPPLSSIGASGLSLSHRDKNFLLGRLPSSSRTSQSVLRKPQCISGSPWRCSGLTEKSHSTRAHHSAPAVIDEAVSELARAHPAPAAPLDILLRTLVLHSKLSQTLSRPQLLR
jgi:hypothetical protein